jgi:ribosomal protein L5
VRQTRYGNFTIGLREQLVFPEIDFDKIDKVRGMEITIVTTAQTDEEGRRLRDSWACLSARIRVTEKRDG